MPPAIAGAVLSGVVAAASGATAFGLTGVALGFAVAGANLAFGFIMGALAPKPKTPSFGDFNVQARDRQQVIRQPVAPAKIVYGTVSGSGTLAFASVTGSEKEYLHLAVVHAGHEIDGVIETYFNDEVVGDINGSGNVTTGRFATWARLKHHLGADDQTADSNLVSEVTEWTNDHRLRGLTYSYARLKWSDDVYPTNIPNIKFVRRGALIYDPR